MRVLFFMFALVLQVAPTLASPPAGLPNILHGCLTGGGIARDVTFVWDDGQSSWIFRGGSGPLYIQSNASYPGLFVCYDINQGTNSSVNYYGDIVGCSFPFTTGEFDVMATEWLSYDGSRWALCVGTGLGFGAGLDICLSLIASVWGRPLRAAFSSGFRV